MSGAPLGHMRSAADPDAGIRETPGDAVPLEGIEPPTPSLGRRRSIH